MAKFDKSEKIGLSGLLFRTSGFDSFKIKSRKELISNI
jgi:hypothetical protein